MKRTIKIISSILVVIMVIISLCVYCSKKHSLEIQTSNGVVEYKVELALTPKQQATGLMNREKLPPETGMLFLFSQARIARMWMKNTLIPLDMIFFNRHGRVVRVYPNAIPQDLTVISSGRPVIGVLEINAGEAKKYGITKGSKLDLTKFGK